MNFKKSICFHLSLQIFFLSMMKVSLVFAHGEDKLGPHGGIIKMPSSFHTEVTLNAPGRFYIYLLDMEWKNPTVEKSKVIVNYLPQGKMISQALKCSAQETFFICTLERVTPIDKGALEVTANRLGIAGNKVRYELPLSLSPSQNLSK